MPVAITTPRSLATDYDFGTPLTPRSRAASEAERALTLRVQAAQEGERLDLESDEAVRSAFPTFAASIADLRDWNPSGAMTLSKTDSVEERAAMANLARQFASELTTHSYISQTELSDGRQALLLDIGSWGNLGGVLWARRTTILGNRHKKSSTQIRRERPLNVSGVGTGAQVCTHDCTLPIALRTTEGKVLSGTYTTPVVNDSPIPGLLGLRALIERRSILDFSQGIENLTITFTGPGKTNIEFSPGSDTFKLYQAPSGHLMLPCCEYERAADVREESGLTLVTSSSASSSSVHPALAELHAQDAAEDAQIAADVAKDPFNWNARLNDQLPVSRSRSAGADEQRRVTRTFRYTQE